MWEQGRRLSAYDEDAALRVGTYFRRGMQMGSVCGAITGGLMALGLAGIDDPALADGLFRKFRDRHDGTTNCGDLLRISAEKGEVKLDHCNALIRECIVYVEEALREKGRIE